MSRRWIYDETRPPGQRMVPVPLDWRPKPRAQVAIHGVKAPFKSHADGKMYDDRRTYERELRARGYEIVGNERRPFFEPERPRTVLSADERAQIAHAADQLGFTE
ncbi:MAG: hypothetical protein AB7O44_27355 [Hyphomicrobiaceae bacterium]|uniref:hypothetical protein n=1 Tax=Hyphomicrobium sp. TaxID=82 RepID=UPI003D0A9602